MTTARNFSFGTRAVGGSVHSGACTRRNLPALVQPIARVLRGAVREIRPEGGDDEFASGFEGTPYGATDEFGWYSVEKNVHVHDLYATMLTSWGSIASS